MELETERLRLREFAEDDFAAAQVFLGNLENLTYWAGPNSEAQTRQFLAKAVKDAAAQPREHYDFAVIQKSGGALIGLGGIDLRKNDYFNRYVDGCLSWLIRKDRWRQGYGTELGARLIQFGFEALALHRLFADCDAKNVGSWGIMERCGMRREGVFREVNLARDGSWHDAYEYAILREEYETLDFRL